MENVAKLSDESKNLVERHMRNILRKRQLLLLFMVIIISKILFFMF